MSTNVHPSAVVEKGAELADGVTVGPFAYVGAHVKLGKGTVVMNHATIDGHTELGEGNVVYPYASVGTQPQDLKYKGEPTQLKMGHRNRVREFATVNIGTVTGGGLTTVGDENLIMATAHIAHDCHVGSRCVLTNAALLAGHVTLEDYVILGGASAIHQFVTVGAHVIVQAGSMIGRDVPPFMIAAGRGGSAGLYGLNSIGLRRRGFTSEQRMAMKRAYRIAFRESKKPADAVGRLETEFKDSKEAQQIAAFIKASKRGVLLDGGRLKKKANRGAGDPAEGTGDDKD